MIFFLQLQVMSSPKKYKKKPDIKKNEHRSVISGWLSDSVKCKWEFQQSLK